MDRKDRVGETETEPQQPEQPQTQERTVAPPIEREHETAEGIVEEDEQRKQERR